MDLKPGSVMYAPTPAILVDPQLGVIYDASKEVILYEPAGPPPPLIFSDTCCRVMLASGAIVPLAGVKPTTRRKVPWKILGLLALAALAIWHHYGWL